MPKDDKLRTNFKFTHTWDFICTNWVHLSWLCMTSFPFQKNPSISGFTRSTSWQPVRTCVYIRKRISFTSLLPQWRSNRALIREQINRNQVVRHCHGNVDGSNYGDKFEQRLPFLLIISISSTDLIFWRGQLWWIHRFITIVRSTFNDIISL